jgi:hypothetical protein
MQWVFLGILSNTTAAAMAFEIAHNKILERVCEYKGGTPIFIYRLGWETALGLWQIGKSKRTRGCEAQRARYYVG